MSRKFDIRDYDNPRVVLEKLNLESKLQDYKTKNNSSEPVKSSCLQPMGIRFNYKIKKCSTNENNPVTKDKHDNKQNVPATDRANAQIKVSATNDMHLVPNKMYKVVLVDGQLTLAEHNEDYIVEDKVQDHKTKTNSPATLNSSCPQPKGIIFNYNIKKRATDENKPVREDKYDNKQNVPANNVSAIDDTNPVPNKMYKVVLVDGQLTLAEHDEDYIVEDNVKQSNESDDTVDGDDSEKNNINVNENVTVSTKKKPAVPPIILNKVIDNRLAGSNTPKNIKSYSLNMDSNKNLVQNITIKGANNKMYATLDDLADAREGKAMVLLPLEKYTRLKTQLKESKICEETLNRQEQKLRSQINGYQRQQEYLLAEEARLNDQLRVTKKNEEMYSKILKAQSAKQFRHAGSQTGPYMEKELENLRAFKTRMSEIFNEAQISMMMMAYPKKVRESLWSDADKEKLIFLKQLISPAAYVFLKTKMNFPLPSSVTVRQWMKGKNIPVKSKKIAKLPAVAVNVAAQESAEPQDASASNLQTHNEHISITILTQDQHMLTIQPEDEHMHTIQPQDEHMHTIQPQDEHMHTIQPQDEHMPTIQYQNEDINNIQYQVETETTQAINSIVDHQQSEGIGTYDMISVPADPGEEFIVYANENLQPTMDTNLDSDYMDNDNIASTEEIVHTEVEHTEVVHTEVEHTKEVKTKCFLPRCRLCMISFTTKEQVREHVLSHYQNGWYTTYLDAKKPFTCEFCNELVKDRHQLVYHHRAHLGIDPLKCYYPGCTYVGTNNVRLISHLQQHKEPTFKCEQCPKMFRKYQDLRNHRGSHSTFSFHRCTLCRAAFYNDYTYQQHLPKHNKPPSVRCRAAGCPERFYSRAMMKQHFGEAHERTVVCPKCPATFWFKKQLDRHLRRHETCKVNHCVTCMKVFYDYGEYFAHAQEHKNTSKKCACGEGFPDRDKLAEHKLQCTFVPTVKPKPERRGRKRKNPEGGDPSKIERKRRKYKKRQVTTVKENATASRKTCKANIIIHKQEIIKKAHAIQFKEPAMSPDLEVMIANNDTGKPGKIIKLKKLDALPANFRDKLIPLPPNFQQKIIALPRKKQQKVCATAENTEATLIALPENPEQNDTDIMLPANLQHNESTLSTDPQHTDISLSTNPQYTDVTLPSNTQHTDITLPSNPQDADITLLANTEHTDITLSTDPQHTDITLPSNTQQTDITLPSNPQLADVTLPANPQQRLTTLPANPQRRVTALLANPEQRVTALPGNLQQKLTTLSANLQKRITTLPGNRQRRVTALLANPQQRVTTLPANSQQSNIAVQADQLISSLENHLIIKPRSYQPRILARSGSHRQHVPVTPVQECNLQGLVSVSGKQNATALQKIKLEPGSTIPAAPFSDKTQQTATISGTKGYYLNKLSMPHGSRAPKIVTVSSRFIKKEEEHIEMPSKDTVLKDMTYLSEFVKTLKSESDEDAPKIESAVPKLKKVVPIGMKQKKLVLQTPRASGHQSVRGIPLEETAVSVFSQRDMPDLEL